MSGVFVWPMQPSVDIFDAIGSLPYSAKFHIQRASAILHCDSLRLDPAPHSGSTSAQTIPVPSVLWESL